MKLVYYYFIFFFIFFFWLVSLLLCGFNSFNEPMSTKNRLKMEFFFLNIKIRFGFKN